MRLARPQIAPVALARPSERVSNPCLIDFLRLQAAVPVLVYFNALAFNVNLFHAAVLRCFRANAREFPPLTLLLKSLKVAELVSVIVRRKHLARSIVNANHSVM